MKSQTFVLDRWSGLAEIRSQPALVVSTTLYVPSSTSSKSPFRILEYVVSTSEDS